MKNSTVVKMQFDTDIARELNVNAAIIFANIQYWVFINAQKGRNKQNGYYWTYNSYKDFQEYFVWLSVKQIRDAINKLELAGYIIVDEFNDDNRDRTKWYSIPHNHSILPNGQVDCPKGQMQVTKSSPAGDQMVASYKEQIINTNNKHISHTDFKNIDVVDAQVLSKQPSDIQMASQFMAHHCPTLLSDLQMKAPKHVTDNWSKVIQHFDSKCLSEGVEYSSKRLYGRLMAVINNWKKDDTTAIDNRTGRNLMR